jgi:gliding motility-associated-like protein
MKSLFRHLKLIYLCVIPFVAQGTHVIGGSLTMTQLDKKHGKYRITLNILVNADHLVQNEDVLMLSEINYPRVIRKRDNLFMPVPKCTFEKFEELIYENPACEQTNGIHTREYRYVADVQWDINDFDDDAGYYLVYERCCRDKNLKNVIAPQESGMVIYLEFPPLKKYPQYSSPDFPILNGDFICKGKPFKFDFGAKDIDGDELRYSLVNPWKGHNTEFTPRTIAEAAPYDLVDWVAGYSANNMIKGSPALQIDAKTGKLTVTASDTGSFVFTVQVDEYRDGKKIGLVRHDFQFKVTVCNTKTPPVGVITQNGKIVQSIDFCSGGIVMLETKFDATMNYQWQKDGDNIVGAKFSTLNVTEPGEYNVIKSFKNECASDTSSQAVKVINASTSKAKINANQNAICDGQTTKLSVIASPNLVYTWYEGNNIIKKDSVLIISKSGTYMVEGLNASSNCKTLRDTIKINEGAKPILPNFTKTDYSICKGDSAKFEVPLNNLYTYQWYFNGLKINDLTKNIIYSKQDGKYQLEVKDASGCSSKTPELSLTNLSPATLQFDSIPALCSQAKVVLKANPANGIFTGKGVNNTTFDPILAGVGRHIISYTVGDGSNCKSSINRIIEVKSPIILGLAKQATVRPNETITLQTNPNQNGLIFSWTPPNGLNSTTIQSPVASITEDIAYTVTATSSDGCKSSETIKISAGIFLRIPNAFSPDDDRLNDFWTINGIERFPDCEVSVYNSWGENIFYSKGYTEAWDGKYKGQTVPNGVYYYKILTHSKEDKIYQGALSVIY